MIQVIRLFALSFENENGRISHSNYYLSQVEIKDYNVKIDAKNFFDESINNDTKTYEKTRKNAFSETELSLMKNLTKLLAENIWISLRWPASVSAAYVEIRIKTLESGTKTLIVSNDEMEDVIEIVKILVF